MRSSLLLASGLLAGLTAGCVAYPGGYAQPGYAQPGYPPPNYAPPAVVQPVPTDEPTYYEDQPAVIYGGQPAFIIEDPQLGWGWRDPSHRWHSAPPGWRGPQENPHFRGSAPLGYRPQGQPDPRQPQPGYGQQRYQPPRDAGRIEQRPDQQRAQPQPQQRPQAQPQRVQQPQPQRPPQNEAGGHRNCQPGQPTC